MNGKYYVRDSRRGFPVAANEQLVMLVDSNSRVKSKSIENADNIPILSTAET